MPLRRVDLVVLGAARLVQRETLEKPLFVRFCDVVHIYSWRWTGIPTKESFHLANDERWKRVMSADERYS